MATINVADETKSKKQTFIVHKDFICHYSPFFHAAFNGRFVEGQTQIMELEDVEPAAFHLFVSWLYSQRLMDEQEESPSATTLIRLWLLADRFLIPRLQNEVLAAVDKLRCSQTQRPGGPYHSVYNNTLPGSPLRRYLVQVWGSGTGAKLEHLADFPPEMLFDMVNHMKPGNSTKSIRFSKESLKQFFVEGSSETPK